MQHCILVKWNEEVTDKMALLPGIQAIFDRSKTFPGIHGVEYITNVIDRPNRYDLLIRIDMDKDVLSDYDASEFHHAWKDGYSAKIAKKAIFDYED